jgi:hypothetical protein
VPPSSRFSEPHLPISRAVLRPRHRTSRIRTTGGRFTAPGHCSHPIPISAINSFADVDRRRLRCDTANGKNTAPAVSPLGDCAVLARRNRQKSMTTTAWGAASAAVTLWPERVLPRDLGRSCWTPTRPARDLIQPTVRQSQWENCLTTAMSRSGRGAVCLVASDSWPLTFTFSLADADEEV